ncbi:putative NAD-dependent epimerase/dehydratase [Paratrimastix pyriformis]|uniref:NAD-dependent epimerase/dehydratase n=1 Tax=Paratrimastix pyriformis TaxID=342808 RepID=A0ABQ8UK29_9EUKA|nr:putative NAD-dependent epimerase/dehydratase [Paratrimastix pyriformis]
MKLEEQVLIHNPVFANLFLQGPVLVLGSGGLIGRALTEWLHLRNFTVLEVKGRAHIDLRIPHSLDQFNSSNVQYVFFLAAEVGGARFLENPHRQLDIIENNLRIYQNVFPWLESRGIPFLFTSSYMQHMGNSYGVIKRLGETWIKELSSSVRNASLPDQLSRPTLASRTGGRVARFYNVYDVETRGGERRHVINDWVDGCHRSGRVVSRSDGTEIRQFLHASDAAQALGLMMLLHKHLEPVTDVASGRWVTLRQLADEMQQVLPDSCTFHFDQGVLAPARERLDPRQDSLLYHYFRPSVTLRDGLRRIAQDEYARKTR